MEEKPPPSRKKPAPAAENRPQVGPARSGRGSASALEAWKKLEQSRVPRESRDPDSSGR